MSIDIQMPFDSISMLTDIEMRTDFRPMLTDTRFVFIRDADLLAARGVLILETVKF